MLREGLIPEVPRSFSKIVNVGHSYGSLLTYALAGIFPNATDGLILTGFSPTLGYLPAAYASWNSKLARLNQPLRFGNVSAPGGWIRDGLQLQQLIKILESIPNVKSQLSQIYTTSELLDFASGLQQPQLPHSANLPSGYLTWSNIGSMIYTFLYPGNYDPAVAVLVEQTKYTYTVGELLTLNGPSLIPDFTGPVQVVTGEFDQIFCGGDCYATGDPSMPSIPALLSGAFPRATAFEAYIQPNTGHGINLHYNSTAAYTIMQEFLGSHGLASA